MSVTKTLQALMLHELYQDIEDDLEQTDTISGSKTFTIAYDNIREMIDSLKAFCDYSMKDLANAIGLSETTLHKFRREDAKDSRVRVGTIQSFMDGVKKVIQSIETNHPIFEYNDRITDDMIETMLKPSVETKEPSLETKEPSISDSQMTNNSFENKTFDDSNNQTVYVSSYGKTSDTSVVKSIKQLADELGVVKQTIRNHKPQDMEFIYIDGVCMIDHELENAILKSMARQKSTRGIVNRYFENDTQPLIKRLQEENEYLKSRLVQRDKEIERRDEIVKQSQDIILRFDKK